MTNQLGRIASALVALVAITVGSTGDVLAQAQWQQWTMCTPGAFRSCNSVMLTTLATFAGGVRSGTQITITLHNLQGQDVRDNVTWSTLETVVFRGTPSSPFQLWSPKLNGGGNGGSGPLQLSGGATGLGFGSAWDEFGNAIRWETGGPSYEYLAGCTAPPPQPNGVYFVAFTCGPTATASLSFSTPMFWDAELMTSASIAVGVGDQSTWFGASCAADALGPDCTVIASPEPGTIVLVATGLSALAAARSRRRRKGIAA